MKFPKPFKRYVVKLSEYLRTEVFCGEYQMNIEYHEDLGEATMAQIRIDPTYLNFTLKISAKCLELYNKSKYYDLAEILTHEFSHLLTEPLYKIAVDAITNTSEKFLTETRERQTQRITNILLSKIPKKVYTPLNNKHSPKKAKKRK